MNFKNLKIGASLIVIGNIEIDAGTWDNIKNFAVDFLQRRFRLQKHDVRDFLMDLTRQRGMTEDKLKDILTNKKTLSDEFKAWQAA